MALQDLSPKRFTKQNPVNKVDIWRCFRGRRAFREVDAITVYAMIGTNAPRNLLQRGYADLHTGDHEDTFVLTKAGRVWLAQGLENHLKRHIEDVRKVRGLPPDMKMRLASRIAHFERQGDLFKK